MDFQPFSQSFRKEIQTLALNWFANYMKKSINIKLICKNFENCLKIEN